MQISNYDIGCEPSPSVPSETLLQDGWGTFLLFFAVSKTIGSNGSVFALLRIQFSRWLMLVTALIFFGILGFQSAVLLISSTAPLVADAAPKLWANVIRNAVEISINVWALLSAKATAFFSGTNPNQSFNPNASGAA